MAQKYYQKEIETMSREDMKKLQSEKLVKQVKHVYENVPYYRDLMDKKGVKPEDIQGIDDLHKLPFLSKADLRDAYPYGLLATPLEDCVRIHSTSGTTGRRVVAFYTQHDIDLWEDCCARAITAAGGTKKDVCQVAYGFGLFTGGAGENQWEVREGATAGLEYMGVKMDAEKNRACRATEAVLSADDSKVTVCCIPTDEELMIALDTQALC